MAKKWLEETWSFLSNVEKASNLVNREKQVLKEECGTRFRGYDVDDDGEACSIQVTDDLQLYIDDIKSNASMFL